MREPPETHNINYEQFILIDLVAWLFWQSWLRESFEKLENSFDKLECVQLIKHTFSIIIKYFKNRIQLYRNSVWQIFFCRIFLSNICLFRIFFYCWTIICPIIFVQHVIIVNFLVDQMWVKYFVELLKSNIFQKLLVSNIFWNFFVHHVFFRLIIWTFIIIIHS